MQTVSTALNRSKHVWVRTVNGYFKCVLCGGVVRVPDDDCDVLRYDPLTDEERKLCPPLPSTR
jgi:hypothetical protein